MRDEILKRLGVIRGILDPLMGRASDRLARIDALDATMSLLRWIESKPLMIEDADIDDAAFLAAVADVFGDPMYDDDLDGDPDAN